MAAAVAMSRRRRRVSLSASADAIAPARSPPSTTAPYRPSAPTRTGPRIDAIDTLRGSAICLMVVYHFAYDLRAYGVTRSDFGHDPFWLALRAFIVTSFMALVGVSLVLAERAHATRRHFWRRIAVITACALVVSLASSIAFPQTFIYFGILHAIAVSSVLVAPLVRRPRAALAIGLAVAAAGLVWSNPWFDPRPLSWIGFVATKPPTEDYVPLAPWAGVVAIGIAVGHWLARHPLHALARLGRAPRWLQWLGRHSLLVYMIHQPLLLAVLWLVVRR
jgi:uncharacterized membrane protein